jgi:hypothetical protein
VTRPIKSDRGLRLAEVLWGSLTHDVDHPTRMFELMSGLKGDGSTINWHDRLLPEEWCISLSRWVALGLLALGDSSHGHVVLHHVALFKFVPNGYAWFGQVALRSFLK